MCGHAQPSQTLAIPDDSSRTSTQKTFLIELKDCLKCSYQLMQGVASPSWSHWSYHRPNWNSCDLLGLCGPECAANKPELKVAQITKATAGPNFQLSSGRRRRRPHISSYLRYSRCLANLSFPATDICLSWRAPSSSEVAKSFKLVQPFQNAFINDTYASTTTRNAYANGQHEWPTIFT